MRKIVAFAILFFASIGCSQQDFPVLHPEVQKPQDYPCGLNMDQYQVVMPPETIDDYDYVMHTNDNHHYKVKKICCPEGYRPWISQPGYCAAK